MSTPWNICREGMEPLNGRVRGGYIMETQRRKDRMRRITMRQAGVLQAGVHHGKDLSREMQYISRPGTGMSIR